MAFRDSIESNLFSNTTSLQENGLRKDTNDDTTSSKFIINLKSATVEPATNEQTTEVNSEEATTTKKGKQSASKRQKAQKNKGVANRTSEKRLTGKGVTYKYDSEDEAYGHDDLESSNSEYVVSRKRACKGYAINDSASKKRNPWKPHEDEQLMKLIKQHGKKWSLLSKIMGGARTGKQIRDRYLNKLDPSIQNHSEWTAQEDELLIKYWKKLGNRWSEIAKHLKGRTESMVKNRYYSHIVKLQAKPQKKASEQASKAAAKKKETPTPIQPVQNDAEPVVELPQEENVTETVKAQDRMSIVYPKNRSSDMMVISNRSSECFSNLLEKYESERNRASQPKKIEEDEAIQNIHVQNRMSIIYPKNRNSDMMVLSNRSSASFNMIENRSSGVENVLDNQLLDLLNLRNNTYTQVQQQEVIQEIDNYLGDEDYFNLLRHPQVVEPENDYFSNHSEYSDSIFRRFGRRGSDDLSNNSSPRDYAEVTGYFNKLEGCVDFQDDGLESFANIGF